MSLVLYNKEMINTIFVIPMLYHILFVIPVSYHVFFSPCTIPCTSEKKVHNFSHKIQLHKKIPKKFQRQKIQNNTKKNFKNQEKTPREKERHTDETSTNNHLQKTMGEVISGNLTPLAKSMKH